MNQILWNWKSWFLLSCETSHAYFCWQFACYPVLACSPTHATEQRQTQLNPIWVILIWNQHLLRIIEVSLCLTGFTWWWQITPLHFLLWQQLNSNIQHYLSAQSGLQKEGGTSSLYHGNTSLHKIVTGKEASFISFWQTEICQTKTHTRVSRRKNQTILKAFLLPSVIDSSPANCHLSFLHKYTSKRIWSVI